MSACETDVNRKVAAFSMYLNANKETGQNLTNENMELLSKFAEFLKADKLEKHKHKHEFKRGHGKFGKHGHHGMYGPHFGKHGPFGKHGHGHGHGHGHKHGHHGKHGGGRHEFGKHGFDFGNGPEFYGKHGQNMEFFGKHDKHHKMGKHFWKWAMFHEQCKNNENGECVIATAVPSQDNASPTAIEGSSEENLNRACDFRHHHWGHHGRWQMCPYKRNVTATTTQPEPSQTEANVAPQENLATMVESISIANSPSPSPQKE